MIYKLPILANQYDQTFNLQLISNTYTFRVRFNQTEGSWYCYLGLLGEDPKVKFKLVNGINLLAPFAAYEEVPSGILIMYDQDLIYGRPGKDDFHKDGRFVLIFAN